MDILTQVGHIAALSVAAERLTNIAKGMLNKYLGVKEGETTKRSTEEENTVHIAKVNFTALLCGIVTALVAWLMGVLPAATWATAVAYGILAAGGSGLWNSVMAYLLSIKDLKQTQMFSARETAVINRELRKTVAGRDSISAHP